MDRAVNLLLSIEVIDGPVLAILGTLSIALVIYLLLRGRDAEWFVTAGAAMLVGALVGCGVLWIVNVVGLLGGPAERGVWFWAPAGFAAIGLAVVNLWRARWWRVVVAVVAILVFTLTTFLGVNAVYGIGRTLAAFLHVSTASPVAIPSVEPTPGASTTPLYQRWKPPKEMPSHGTVGLVPGGIPNTASEFGARPAQVYLPPAALVADPPELPLVIMMMGQPGDPDASYIGDVLDDYQAQHDGLAPIALVVDQLGDPFTDPLCLNAERGQVETYVMTDVVGWARSHLNIQQGRDAWTVAGYSNGGACAAYFGSKHPDVFGNLLDVSGVEYPGAETSSIVLDQIFDGDQSAFDAVKPASIMRATGDYPDTVAVFTMGQYDEEFRPGYERLWPVAKAAGMRVTHKLIIGAGHGLEALDGGLDEGFRVLCPRLGLDAGE